jgi:hypothetical protein
VAVGADAGDAHRPLMRKVFDACESQPNNGIKPTRIAEAFHLGEAPLGLCLNVMFLALWGVEKADELAGERRDQALGKERTP